MNHTRTLLRRGGVALATAGLLASGMVGLAPSANAAETGAPDQGSGTVTWEISQMLGVARDHLMAPQPGSYGAPATYSAPLSTWGAGAGTVAADGSADLSFGGSAYLLATDSGSWLRIADLGLDIAADGAGTVTADVTYGTDNGATTQRTGTDLPIVDLSVDPGVVGESDDPTYPASYDALTYDFEATASTYTWTNLRGRWSSQLLTFLNGDAGVDPAVPAFSFKSLVANTVDGSSRIRYPAPFAISVDRVTPSVEASVVGASYGDGLSLSVAGAGFRGVTNPGDAGVYVGLAEGSELPDVSTVEGMGSFVASSYVPAGAIADGAFSSALHADTSTLDPTKSYSIFTWQAHSHSNSTQDSVTPVEIDWAALEAKPSTVTTGGASGTTYGKTAVVTAAVPAAGTVTLTGLGATQSQTLAAPGIASFTVPASLTAGSYTATFAYGGGGDYLGSQATKTFSVAKAATRTVAKVAPRPTAKKAGRATVALVGAAAGSKVTVVVKKGGTVVKRSTVKVNAQGKVVVGLPKAAKGGAFVVTATYAGDTNHQASSGKASYQVTKPKKR